MEVWAARIDHEIGWGVTAIEGMGTLDHTVIRSLAGDDGNSAEDGMMGRPVVNIAPTVLEAVVFPRR